MSESKPLIPEKKQKTISKLKKRDITQNTARKWWLFTYPHCNICKEKLLELFLINKLIKDEIEYIICCEEKHKDGQPHNHVLVIMKKAIKLTREQVGYGFDLVREYNNHNEGEDVIEDWYWLFEYAALEIDEPKIEDMHGGLEYIQVKPGKFVTKDSVEGKNAIQNGANCLIMKYHGNIKGLSTVKGGIAYCKKQGNWIEKGNDIWSMETGTMKKKEVNNLVINGDLLQLMKNGDISIYQYDRLRRIKELVEAEERKQLCKPFFAKIVCVYIFLSEKQN